MAVRTSLIFGVTTETNQPTNSRPHSGGWSESVWSGDDTVDISDIRALAERRSRLLPKQIQIIGYRTAKYSLENGVLTPQGANAGNFRYPGYSGWTCDMPQIGLMLSLRANLGNTSRQTIRGLPDEMVTTGEFQPTPTFLANLREYLSLLVDGQWGFIGRLLSNATARILSITDAGVVTLAEAADLNENNFVRLLRVRDNDGNPVTGRYRIGPVTNAGTTFTLIGYNHGVSVSSVGRIRKDQIY